MSALEDLKSWSRRQGAPVTVALVATMIVAGLVFSSPTSQLVKNLAFDESWILHPWSLLSYPFLASPLSSTGALLGFVFAILWLFWIGSSLERDAGTPTYVLLLATMTVLPALLLWIGMATAGIGFALAGPLLPGAGLTVAWGTRNPQARVMIWGIIPITGMWIAILAAVGVLLMFGSVGVPFGLLACGHLALAWAFGSGRLPINFRSGVAFRPNIKEIQATRAQARYDESYYDDVRKREKEREERERLRKLFGEDEEGPPTVGRGS